ncbi:MAG: SpoIVB peptidase S55 domain-containing protein, partial [Candidatus Spyradocola sp.]
MTQGQEKSYSFFLPVKVEVDQEGACVSSSTDETLGSRSPTLTTRDVGSARVTFRLLGCIPLRTAMVQVDSERVLIPGGQSIGLTMYTDGVFIVDCASVYRADGTAVYPAREAGLTSGDCITGIDGKTVDSMQALMDAVRDCDGTLAVEYVRDGRARRTSITPATDESGEKRLGVWVRDSTAGIGTLTFVDPQNGTFGALGHAVTDQDTGKVLPIRSGEVYLSEIIDVKKGSRGEAGELHGVFTGGWNSAFTLPKNPEFGVY